MKVNYLYFTILLIFTATSYSCSTVNNIQKSGVTLEKLLTEGALTHADSLLISGKSLEKAMESLEKKNLGAMSDIGNYCLYSFIKWCNKFIGEKRDYVYIPLPMCGFSENNWNDITGDYEVAMKPKTCFDPHIKDLLLNDYLINKDIIICTSNRISEDSLTHDIMAIIPYSDGHYRLTTSFIYVYQLDFDRPIARNIKQASKIIGERISDNSGPYIFMDNDGDLNSFSLVEFSFIFEGSEDILVKPLDIRPQTDPITVQNLFY